MDDNPFGCPHYKHTAQRAEFKDIPTYWLCWTPSPEMRMKKERFIVVKRLSRIHFMTSYFEYLLRNGIRNEDDHIGDASRFLRYLLSRVDATHVESFFDSRDASPGYRRRLRRTLGRFFEYTRECLEIDISPE